MKRVLRFLATYSRDLWLLVITLVVLGTLAAFASQQSKLTEQGDAIATQSYVSCERSKLIIPMLGLALRMVLPPEYDASIAEYEASRPERCFR